MADRFRLFVTSEHGRRRAAEALRSYPLPFVVECREETRTDAQNRLLWPLLTDVSKQVSWYGRTLSQGDWKNGMMIGLDGADFVPGINPGTLWPLGLSSSVLGVGKFSELIDLVYAFGAEHNVAFRTDKARTLERMKETISSGGTAGGRATPDGAGGSPGVARNLADQ